MKNKRNKKLLSSVLVALSLSSSVSINNKIANANYKNIDRERLNSLFTNTNNKDIGSELFDTVKNIRKHRYDNNQSSILYNSIVGNSINNFLNNEENKKHYGPDLCKALLYQLRAVHGGHFTVWNDKIKSKIKDLEDKFCNEINCCDAWFYALGGTQKDIDEYTKKAEKLKNLFDFHLTEISDQDIATFNLGNPDLNLTLKDFGYISVINKDTPRTWGEAKKFDSNIAEKEKVLNHVLKVYVYDKHDYSQGFNFWCQNIIDKPFGCKGCKNKTISKEMEAKIYKEMEAKIYYVFKATIDKLFKTVDDILRRRVDVLQYRDAFIKNHKNLKLPNPLLDDNEEVNNNYRVFFPCVFFGGLNFLDRNSRIKLLDEIIYSGDFKNKKDTEIIQKMMDEAYKAVINNDKNFKDNDKKYGLCYERSYSIMQYLKGIANRKLQFSNDV